MCIRDRPWEDFAILFRANTQSRIIEQTLREHKIPYRMVGAQIFCDRKEVKDLISYLATIENPQAAAVHQAAGFSQGLRPARPEGLIFSVRQNSLKMCIRDSHLEIHDGQPHQKNGTAGHGPGCGGHAPDGLSLIHISSPVRHPIPFPS